MELKIHRVTTENEIEICFEIRKRVYIEEQGVTEEEEFDNLDSQCRHFLAEYDNQWVGTARLYKKNHRQAKVERVAVLNAYRFKGVGRALLEEMENFARESKFEELVLGAQTQAIPFYQKSGYRVYGQEFFDARIPHRWMKKTFHY